MQTLIIIRNALDPKDFKRFDNVDACEVLEREFVTFPETARLYHHYCSKDHDVTPHTPEEIEALKHLNGIVYCVVYPGIEWVILAIVAVVAIAAAAFILTAPQVTATGQRSASSPNNNLSDRQNKARPNGRIPDIFGKVRSTPDLLTVPYKIFNSKNVEIEISYMCVGRGSYELDDIKDGDTLVSEIVGTSLQVYDPFTSPNFGTPSLTIGDAITDAFLNVKQVTGVNGQTLPAPNAGSFTWTSAQLGATNSGGSQVTMSSGQLKDMRNLFGDGDRIQLSGFAPGGVNLDGIYQIPGVAPYFPIPGGGAHAVGKLYVKLWEPQFVNPNWGSLSGGSTTGTLTNLDDAASQWIGPFTIDMSDLTTIICNFVALQGLYTVTNSGDQDSLDIDIEVEATPINADGSPRGAVELFTTTLSGSAVSTGQVGVTLYCAVASPGRYSVRVHRTTDHNYTFSGQTVEEVKIKEIYGAAPITQTDFGNVTTIFARSLGTTQALSVKERKLNMWATRKLPARVSGSTFTVGLFATQSADDIISAICLDPYLGNQLAAQMDFDTIYSTIAAVKTYFGTDEVGQFNYTFDKEDLSFENTVQTVASAILCQAYRRGSIITLSFEQATPDSSLLFNHRNKAPGSETRTISFGNQNDYDGVWLDYISSVDGAKVTYYIPANQSSVNPKKIDGIGITSLLQAYFHAWRAWNKIRYQNIAVAFTAMQEANKLVMNERILVADNTRSSTQDGEIWDQIGLELTLSQSVNLTGGSYSIFIQHYDGTIENISITAGSASNKVLLAVAPRLSLALDEQQTALPTYLIVGATAVRELACLVTEKKPQDNYTVDMTCANYDARFYQNDLDHINALI